MSLKYDDALRAVNSRFNSGKVSVRRAIGQLREAERVLGFNITGAEIGVLTGEEPGCEGSRNLIREIRIAVEKLERISKGEAG